LSFHEEESLSVAIYPGTFDPIHYGHMDVARRAAAIFDHLVVGVYAHPRKALMFPLDERLGLARQALSDIPNISVEGYEGLTVDFAAKHNARVIVRGLRVISDFELEYQMAMTTRKLSPEMDMVCLMTSLEHAFISSTMVKEIVMAGGCVDQMVPDFVAQYLSERISAPNATGGQNH
jgi:pantetheine-phosphate adenylyltransferase